MTLIIIILLICLVIYLYYQNRKLQGNSNDNSSGSEVNSSSSHRVIFDSEEDLIADRDQALRNKNETEQELISVSNKLKLKNQEVNRKDNEIERLKKEKSQVEITLNTKIKQTKQQHTAQLRQINLLFDPQAKDYQSIDFNGLYNLLAQVAQQNKDLPGSFPQGDNK